MYHLIEFTRQAELDAERGRLYRLERVRVRPGSCFCAQLRPYVLESPAGPLELADLYLDDGALIRAVPFACFRFVDCAD